MNKNEVLRVLSGLNTAFPAAYKKLDSADGKEMVNLWLKELGGYDAGQVQAVVDAFISEETRGFPPSIGQIKARLPGRMEKPLEGIDRASWERQKKMLDRFQELKKKRIAAGIPADYWDAMRKGIADAEYISMLDRTGLWLIPESL